MNTSKFKKPNINNNTDGCNKLNNVNTSNFSKIGSTIKGAVVMPGSAYGSTVFKQIDVQELQDKLHLIEIKRLKRDQKKASNDDDDDKMSHDSAINDDLFTEKDRLICENLLNILNDFHSFQDKKEYFRLFSVNEFGELLRSACIEQ